LTKVERIASFKGLDSQWQLDTRHHVSNDYAVTRRYFPILYLVLYIFRPRYDLRYFTTFSWAWRILLYFKDTPQASSVDIRHNKQAQQEAKDFACYTTSKTTVLNIGTNEYER
jgi:hypothetical protein